MDHETVRRCHFSTERLLVDEWHRLAERRRLDLVGAVASILTASTTAALPVGWRGDFDRERARRWIGARDAESPTLLVVERRTGAAVGLMILYEATHDDRRAIDVRLGYVVAEASWGEGLARELVAGLVQWARPRPVIGSITGGVSVDNVASARVLLDSGFSPVGDGIGEQIYRLDLG